jgi:hypothetical protein
MVLGHRFDLAESSLQVELLNKRRSQRHLRRPATGPNSSDLPRTGDSVRQRDRQWPGVAKGRSSYGQGRSSPAIVPLPQELGDGDLDGARDRHGEQCAQDAGQFGTEQDGDDHYERR